MSGLKNIFDKKLMIKVLYTFSAFLFIAFNKNVAAHVKENLIEPEQTRVIALVKKAENYIKKNGQEKAVIEFKINSYDIFMADYSGNFLVSPLHPELIGHNQFNYKDPTGALVVQEEINKAKAGGGWLKGRWRQNPQNGKYECRKIYIQPMLGNYLIGSWYHYPSNKPGVCLT